MEYKSKPLQLGPCKGNWTKDWNSQKCSFLRGVGNVNEKRMELNSQKEWTWYSPSHICPYTDTQKTDGPESLSYYSTVESLTVDSLVVTGYLVLVQFEQSTWNSLKFSHWSCLLSDLVQDTCQMMGKQREWAKCLRDVDHDSLKFFKVHIGQHDLKSTSHSP